MTAQNPLVATPDPRVAEYEGAGVFDSLDDAAAALQQDRPDPAEIGSNLASAGLELLGAAMNPLGALAAAGVGWLIEHVEFLNEGLDQLAGDPAQITAQAQTWQNVSTELAAIAVDYERSVDELRGWDGAAAQAYRATAGPYTNALRATSGQAADMSRSLTLTGAAVGTVRALIRDSIAEWIGGVVARFVVALATSWASFGGSVAAFVASTVASAASLASQIASKIARLLETLGGAADRLRVMSSGFSRLGSEAGEVTRSLLGSTPAAVRGLDRLGREVTRRLEPAGIPQLAGTSALKIGDGSAAVSPGDVLKATTEAGKQTAEAIRDGQDGSPPG